MTQPHDLPQNPRHAGKELQPKHLKAKTLAATLKSIARNKAPQSRIVIASCLGLCPKKATAVAFAGVDPASLIVAIKSSAQLQEILPLLIGQND
jgi:hypothetical protein